MAAVRSLGSPMRQASYAPIVGLLWATGMRAGDLLPWPGGAFHRGPQLREVDRPGRGVQQLQHAAAGASGAAATATTAQFSDLRTDMVGGSLRFGRMPPSVAAAPAGGLTCS